MPDALHDGVQRYLSGRFPEGGDGTTVTLTPVSGGRSNPTYFVQYGDQDLVLRHPPLAEKSAAAHDVGREYRVLTALAETAVPAPEPVAYCDDPAFIGAPFYLMRRVAGRVVTRADGAPDLADTARATRLGAAMIDALLAIHSVDPAATGLGDPARGDGYVRRQAERWSRQWSERQQRSIPEYDEIGRRLVAALDAGTVDSAPPRPTLVHGDFNLGNTIVANADEFDDADTGVVRAVLDWEFATFGHPLMDLGVFVSYNGPRGHLLLDSPPIVSSLASFPSPDELVARYAEGSGLDVSAFDFFYVLGFYRTLIINEDVRRRVLDGELTVPGLADIGRGAPELAAHLLDVADRSPIPVFNGRR